MSTMENIHIGHRQRLKNRFLEEGLEHFDEHQVLELLLFYCIPQRDTNGIAHELLTHFGSLTQVMEAPVEELQKIKGVGESAATFLSLLNAFCRYYQINRTSTGVILSTVDQCGTYLLPFFYGRRNEQSSSSCRHRRARFSNRSQILPDNLQAHLLVLASFRKKLL